MSELYLVPSSRIKKLIIELTAAYQLAVRRERRERRASKKAAQP